MRGIPFFIALLWCVGCSTVHTAATRDIDGIIESKILDSDRPLTREEKAYTKSTLIKAEKEIVTYKTEAQKNARLAKQARVFWIITVVVVLLSAAGVVFGVRSAVIRAVFGRSRDSP